MRIRQLALAGIVATTVIACGEPHSNSAQTASAPPIRTECEAGAANGSVFTTTARPDIPFTLQLPQLTGWQMTPVDGEDLVLRRVDRHAERMSSATVTIGVSDPRSAAGNTVVLSAMEGDWQQWRSESIQVCGWGGTRSAGILPASGTDGVDRYHEFLAFDYLAGNRLYPIRMSVESTAADHDVYRSDIDTFVDGLQIVPLPPAG